MRLFGVDAVHNGLESQRGQLIAAGRFHIGKGDMDGGVTGKGIEPQGISRMLRSAIVASVYNGMGTGAGGAVKAQSHFPIIGNRDLIAAGKSLIFLFDGEAIFRRAVFKRHRDGDRLRRLLGAGNLNHRVIAIAFPSLLRIVPGKIHGCSARLAVGQGVLHLLKEIVAGKPLLQIDGDGIPIALRVVPSHFAGGKVIAAIKDNVARMLLRLILALELEGHHALQLGARRRRGKFGRALALDVEGNAGLLRRPGLLLHIPGQGEGLLIVLILGEGMASIGLAIGGHKFFRRNGDRAGVDAVFPLDGIADGAVLRGEGSFGALMRLFGVDAVHNGLEPQRG